MVILSPGETWVGYPSPVMQELTQTSDQHRWFIGLAWWQKGVCGSRQQQECCLLLKKEDFLPMIPVIIT